MIYYADETLAPEEILDSFDPLKDSLTYKIGDFHSVQKKIPDNKTYFKTPRGTIIHKEWLAFLCSLCSTEVIIDRAIFQFFKKKHGNLHPASTMCQICHCRLKHSIQDFEHKKWPIYLKDKNIKPPDETWAFSLDKDKSSSPLNYPLESNLDPENIEIVDIVENSKIIGDDNKVIVITDALSKEELINEAVLENPLKVVLAEDETRQKLNAFWDNLAQENLKSSKENKEKEEKKPRQEHPEKGTIISEGLCQLCKQKIPPNKRAGSKFCSLGCKNRWAQFKDKADILEDL